jgi:tetratricopeptide (TPR) repeat protein
MKQYCLVFALIVIVVLLFTDLDAQILSANRMGIGADLGIQRVFHDEQGTQNYGFGGGIEAFIKYKINPRFSTIASLGYGELSDGNLMFGDCYFSTDVINLDVKGALNLITDGNIIPYGYLGIGGIYFNAGGSIEQSNLPGNGYYFGGGFDASLILGGGFEAKINPALSFDFYIDYRFTTSDHLDGWKGGNSNDGYLNIRTGATYYLSRPLGSGRGSDVRLTQNAPIEEISGEGAGESPDDELNALIEGLDGYDESATADMNMEEYIRLKSKVDQLNDAIHQKELEIEELKVQLANRKERINQLEQQLRNRGGALASSLNVDLSEFSSSYEQALQQYYSREYDAAIYLFSMLLETSPTHRLSSNCQYWLGECYFGQSDYSMALDAFQKVMAYEQSFKKDDALIMMGRCYIFLGDKQTALSMFNQLMNDYPDSEYYQKAQSYANGL